MGPKQRKSTVLSLAEAAAIVVFRKMTQLPIDDVLTSLQETILKLNRSSLHRCLQRQDCLVLEKTKANPTKEKKKFKQYSIGYFHLDIANVSTARVSSSYMLLLIEPLNLLMHCCCIST